jgi:hypothetical protein
MATDSTELARLLTQHRPRHDSDGFPAWLRSRVAAYVVEERAAGAGFPILRDELGVSITTLRRWADRYPLADSGGFSPVLVTDSAPLDLSTTPTTLENEHDDRAPDIFLASPHGFSLHGLSLEQGLRALASLR